MERVVRGRSFTLSKTFYEGGVATAPTATPTVTITRDDGTAVTTGAVSINGAVASVTVPASQNTLLDTLTVDWSAVVGGEAQEYLDTVEVAGGVLFTIAEAQARSGLASKTAAEITEKRTLVESLLEQACAVAFVPRYGTTTINGTGGSTILLPARTTAIRAVTVDGVAVAQSYVDTMRLLGTGELYYPSYFTRGYSNYVIAYEHGYSDGAERLAASEAALTWTKALLVNSPMDDRALTYSTDDASYTMAVPGMRGSVSGVPAVDAFIQQYGLNVAVA
jgi:hypothetical protein